MSLLPSFCMWRSDGMGRRCKFGAYWQTAVGVQIPPAPFFFLNYSILNYKFGSASTTRSQDRMIGKGGLMAGVVKFLMGCIVSAILIYVLIAVVTAFVQHPPT